LRCRCSSSWAATTSTRWPALVEEYYDVLSAPDKNLIWLEGGHGLGSAENKDVFVDVMLEQVRPLTQ
jgi:hypothetical protein